MDKIKDSGAFAAFSSMGGGSHGKSKYGNRRSGDYDSDRERLRGAHLLTLQERGVISGLRRQVRFLLIPAQRDGAGRVMERACYYVADFVYQDCMTGMTVVEDCKGFRTEAYKIKRKLMMWIHGINIKET